MEGEPALSPKKHVWPQVFAAAENRAVLGILQSAWLLMNEELLCNIEITKGL